MRMLRLGAISAIALLFIHSHAWAGNGSDRGGGSSFEERVDQIRADLLKWIDEGGAGDLTLGPSESASLYVSSMRPLLQEHAVSVEFITDAIQAQAIREHNPEKIVQINEHYKECRCFFSKKEQKNKILCRSDVFPKDSTPAGTIDFVGETKQYRLIHHEFAGLAGMEHNIGADSDYHLSDQITASLWPEVDEKLYIRRAKDSCNPEKLREQNFPYRCATPDLSNPLSKPQELVEWQVEEHGYRGLPVYYDTKSGYSVTSVVDFNLGGWTEVPKPGYTGPPYIDPNSYCDPEQGYRLPTQDEFVNLLKDGLRNVLFGLRLRDHLTDEQARKLFGQLRHESSCKDANGEDYPFKGTLIPNDPAVICVVWSELTNMSVFATGPDRETWTPWQFKDDRYGLSWLFNRRGAVPFCVAKKSK